MNTCYKILHVVEATSAGVGRHVLDLSEAQMLSGHEVHVAYSPARMGDNFARRMQDLAGIKWHQCHMRRSLGIHDMSAAMRLRALIRQLRPDFVHGHSAKGGALARLAACRLRCKKLYTPNGVYSMNPKLSWLARRVNDGIEWLLALTTDGIIAVSDEEYQHLRQMGISARKLSIVHNGIQPIQPQDKQHLRQQLGLDPQAPVVGFVGRIDPQKNPFDLIRVFALTALRHDHVLFAVVGRGSLEQETRQLAESFPQLDNRVFWLGERNGQEVMQCFDLLVLPSLYEGFPYVLIEASSVGIPLVVSTGTCGSAIVVDGQSGFICDIGNVEAMAQRVAGLLNDNITREEFSQRAKQQGHKFTVQQMSQGVQQLLKQLQPLEA